MGKLVSGYLSWKYEPCPPAPASDSSPYDFSIEVADIYTVQTIAQIPRSAEVESIAEALVLNGYLPTSPESPSFAVSIKTLELFRCIRLRKPSFSIEAFAKVLCDLYGVRLLVYYIAASYTSPDSIPTTLPFGGGNRIRRLLKNSTQSRGAGARCAWPQHAELEGSQCLPAMWVRGVSFYIIKLFLFLMLFTA